MNLKKLLEQAKYAERCAYENAQSISNELARHKVMLDEANESARSWQNEWTSLRDSRDEHLATTQKELVDMINQREDYKEIYSEAQKKYVNCRNTSKSRLTLGLTAGFFIGFFIGAAIS